jgi:hypothetical protein
MGRPPCFTVGDPRYEAPKGSVRLLAITRSNDFMSRIWPRLAARIPLAGGPNRGAWLAGTVLTSNRGALIDALAAGEGQTAFLSDVSRGRLHLPVLLRESLAGGHQARGRTSRS